MSFQRTLRIPDDGKLYPLPPGLGGFPVHRVSDYEGRVPSTWQTQNGFFIPMYQREALWLGFDGADWKPNAVKIAVGRVNAISGGEWTEALHADPQDYIVCPNQPWLDGINAGEGLIRQFVAMPLGAGYTVEAQVTGSEEFGGIQILVYEPKPGRFPDHPPPRPDGMLEIMPAPMELPPDMGLAAGGMMKQKIYPDPYGIEVWDTEKVGSIFVYIVNSDQYQQLTGLNPPLSPISAQTYTEYGLPWFDLYDENQADLDAPDSLSRVKSLNQQEAEQGITGQEDASLTIQDSDIKKLHHLGNSSLD